MVEMLRYRVVHSGLAGTPYLSTHYATAATSTATALRDAALGFWQQTIALRQSGLISTGDSIVDRIESTNGQLVGSTGVNDWSYVGSAGGDPLPPANQGLLRLDTAVIAGGRRIRGKLFLPSPVEAHAVSGITAASYRADYEAAWDDNFGVGGITPVVWSRSTGVIAEIQQRNVWAQFAVLRSRRD